MAKLLGHLCAIYAIVAGFYTGGIIAGDHPKFAGEVRALASQVTSAGSQAAQDAARWARTDGVADMRQAAKWIDRTRDDLVAARVKITKTARAYFPRTQMLGQVSQLAPTPMPDAVVPESFGPRLAELPDYPKIAGGFPKVEPVLPKVEPAPPEDSEVLAPETPPSAAEVASAQERLRNSLTSDLFGNFDLFLYVSKAEKGPLAQRMYVFSKQDGGVLGLLYAWPVSTGRQEHLLVKTGWQYALETPSGYFVLDPNRFREHYVSTQWGITMPYAMFFNWMQNGEQTGFAIHGVTPEEIKLLGTKASAGCIRLAPAHAQELFNLIRTKYRGSVPRFALDAKTRTMNKDGALWYDRHGKLKMTNGYRVLVFVEDYGGEDVVAVLY